jgi:hypothetical protein
LLIERNNIDAENTMKDLINKDKNEIKRNRGESFLTDLMQHRMN